MVSSSHVSEGGRHPAERNSFLNLWMFRVPGLHVFPGNQKFTLPETNIAPEMDGWKTTFLLGRELFRGYVKLREGIQIWNSLSALKSMKRISFFDCLFLQ